MRPTRLLPKTQFQLNSFEKSGKGEKEQRCCLVKRKKNTLNIEYDLQVASNF